MKFPMPKDPKARAAFQRYQKLAFKLRDAARKFGKEGLKLMHFGFNPPQIFAQACIEGMRGWRAQEILEVASILADFADDLMQVTRELRESRESITHDPPERDQ
jgi:hypothetical protein